MMKSIYLGIFCSLVLSFGLIGCQGTTGEGLVSTGEKDKATGKPQVVIDAPDEIDSESQLDKEFVFNSDTGECSDSFGNEGLNIDGSVICGDFSNIAAPEIDPDSDDIYGLDLKGALISKDQNLTIKDIVKFQIKIDSKTIFEGRDEFGEKIVKVFKKKKKFLKKKTKRIKNKIHRIDRLINFLNKVNDEIVSIDKTKALELKIEKLKNKKSNYKTRIKSIKVKIKFLKNTLIEFN